MSEVIVFVIGLALGSFVNALVWRLHEQSKTNSKKRREQLSIVKGRSLCPQCHHQLSALDLVPVGSWLFLRGKCRYCHKSISWQYPAVELGLALLLLISWQTLPFANQFDFLNLCLFSLWGLQLTLSSALVLYDLRWKLLPNRVIYPLSGVSVVFIVLQAVQLRSFDSIISGVVGGLLIGGFFWLLYQVSNGKWIGGGDEL